MTLTGPYQIPETEEKDKCRCTLSHPLIFSCCSHNPSGKWRGGGKNLEMAIMGPEKNDVLREMPMVPRRVKKGRINKQPGPDLLIIIYSPLIMYE